LLSFKALISVRAKKSLLQNVCPGEIPFSSASMAQTLDVASFSSGKDAAATWILDSSEHLSKVALAKD
jgi:hypothetical protein